MASVITEYGEGTYFSTACLPGLYSCSFHAKLVAKWPEWSEEALVLSAGQPSFVNTPEQAFLFPWDTMSKELSSDPVVGAQS